MSNTNTANGRPERKQLSEQLDRFDKLLDGLAEGLNEAIADAVRDGTRLALKDAIIEILTDPALRTKLQQAAAEGVPAPPTRTRFAGWIRSCIFKAAGAVQRTATASVQGVQNRVRAVASAVKKPVQVLRAFGSMTDLLVIGIVGGLVVAGITVAAPQTVSAIVSGLSGGIASIAMRAFFWTWRTFKHMSGS